MTLNFSTITKSILLAAAVAFPANIFAGGTEAKTDIKKYIPEFHGTMRAFYQLSTTAGDSRFMVRNARLSAGGFVLPKVDYLLQVDFCDRGKIKLLDAYMRVSPANGLQFYAGQMRVPFCVEATRAPHAYIFCDVGLVTVLGNLRSVGVKGSYKVPGSGLYMEGGVFNSTDMIDHNSWNSALTYGVKANYTAGGLKPEIGFMSRVPGGKGIGCRINQMDVSLSWRYGGFFVEGEYIWRHYCGPFSNSQAYSILADYAWPVRWAVANRMSVQSRFEGLTTASVGRYVDGVLPADINPRRRLTVGTTLRYDYGKAHFDYKINYEQYFYSHDVTDISLSDNSKLVVGAVMYF